MARTREFDTEAAVGAAMELFWERGYEATSVDDLVARFGVGRGSLYATFGSKHALYLQALDRYRCEHMAGALVALDDPEAPLKPTLRGFFDALVAEALGEAPPRGCFMVNATTERAGCDAAVAARLRENAAAMEATLVRAIRRALARFLVIAVQRLRGAAVTTPDRAALRDMVRLTLVTLD